jgi:hypothetical protein
MDLCNAIFCLDIAEVHLFSVEAVRAKIPFLLVLALTGQALY